MKLFGFIIPMVLVCLPACDESLPPLVEPAVVLSYVVLMNDNNITLQNAEITAGGIPIISVKNVYDEVLSDKARLSGVLTVRLREKPYSSRRLYFNESDLWVRTMLVGSTLTINVNETLKLSHSWNHRTDAGTPLWGALRFTQGVTSKGVAYSRSDTVWMQISASVQLFEKVQKVDLPMQEFPVIYTIFGAAPSASFSKNQ